MFVQKGLVEECCLEEIGPGWCFEGSGRKEGTGITYGKIEFDVGKFDKVEEVG